MPKSTAPSIDLNFDSVGSDVRIVARGSGNAQSNPRSLGIDRDRLLEFAAGVQRAATAGKPLPTTVIDEARVIQKAVLEGEVGAFFAKLGTPSLVRFMIHDRDLQAVPWEVLCSPDKALGFWATSSSVFPVRGVASSTEWFPREVRGAVKVLAIAPTDVTRIDHLKQSLAERIQTGEIEWLEPIVGSAANRAVLPQQLQSRSTPHVIHFFGHGGVLKGLPALRFADEDGEEVWLPVEVFAGHLQNSFSGTLRLVQNSFSGTLRLVVLEACDSAKPAAFGPAAETLAKEGADAVVAFLWRVRADVARSCSTEFYRSLTADGGGDVARAINAARLSMLGTHDQSAETFSPVLYLRGPDGNIFDFTQRKVAPPRPGVAMPEGAPEIPPKLDRILRTPYSLVLGDRWRDDLPTLDAFRDKLRGELKREAHPPPDGLPMGTLAQWFALHRGSETLEQEFQDSFDAEMDGPAIVSAIARVLCPGVHTTLLRNPWLEHSVAEQRPDRTIYVIQPHDAGVFVVKREAGGKKWERLRAPPDSFDDMQDIILLRPYRGYTSNKRFARPLLTEDDYFLRLRDLWSGNALPPQLAQVLGGTLGRRPALLIGLSMLTANHRMLLHTLYSRGIPRESLAVVDRDDQERSFWEKGAGLPGKDEGVEVIETSSSSLCAMFSVMAKEGGR